ncbi:MAG: phosphoglucosamine mutase [Tannerellaceae bacterium]|jgi:phosphomannomutase|nr:phosphoglucosamine mutase [Tannerellaceae bacterium]
MTLIKSISGIRGTIGGSPTDGLNPLSVVKFTAAYATFIRRSSKASSNIIVVGRDARPSGSIIKPIVTGTLSAMGFNVIDLDFATTPTVELAVANEKACGGIILTASHNPVQWNALKLLNEQGEFLSAADGQEVLDIAEADNFRFCDRPGEIIRCDEWDEKHIRYILDLDLVDVDAIRAANFHVAVDAVNSVGGIILPPFLKALGVSRTTILNGAADGRFAHNPEPLPENLSELSDLMKTSNAHVGFAVDPDVDRLAIVCENGDFFGEEYTLVAVADYILSHTAGAAVSNLSSSRALRDVARSHGCDYHTAAVGEVNVVDKMKATGAVIGGEGNGGVIYPPAHYGRDALAGIALFLSHLAHSGTTPSKLREAYPSYYISKQKVELTPQVDVDALLRRVRQRFAAYDITDIDGVKIDFPDKWVHLRKSNTEPIIRIYAEARTEAEAGELGAQLIRIIQEIQ